jgi:hypothetical protein
LRPRLTAPTGLDQIPVVDTVAFLDTHLARALAKHGAADAV